MQKVEVLPIKSPGFYLSKNLPSIYQKGGFYISKGRLFSI